MSPKKTFRSGRPAGKQAATKGSRPTRPAGAPRAAAPGRSAAGSQSRSAASGLQRRSASAGAAPSSRGASTGTTPSSRGAASGLQRRTGAAGKTPTGRGAASGPKRRGAAAGSAAPSRSAAADAPRHAAAPAGDARRPPRGASPHRQAPLGGSVRDEEPATPGGPQAPAGKRYVYGRHPVQELLRGEAHGIDKILLVAGAEAGSARLQHIMEAAEQQGVTVGQGSKRALFDLVGNVPHQGVVAIVRAFVYTPLAQLGLTGRGNQEKLLLACDQLQDPHNLGSLVRSAAALGACGMVIPKDRACEVTPAVVKTAAGATSHLPIARVVNMVRALQDLKARGYWITGTLPDAPVALSELDLRGPTVIVLGSEGAGLRPLVARTCDTLARIPMADEIGSLNAAVAGAICLYEVARQRLTG